MYNDCLKDCAISGQLCLNSCLNSCALDDTFLLIAIHKKNLALGQVLYLQTLLHTKWDQGIVAGWMTPLYAEWTVYSPFTLGDKWSGSSSLVLICKVVAWLPLPCAPHYNLGSSLQVTQFSRCHCCHSSLLRSTCNQLNMLICCKGMSISHAFSQMCTLSPLLTDHFRRWMY